MNINWYPGHMKKTVEQIDEKKKLVDFYIEIIDARIPISSRNPLIHHILKNKRCLTLINKRDLANPRESEKWVEYLNSLPGERAILYQANKGNQEKLLLHGARELNREILEKRKEKGMEDRSLRAMVVGIPNSGKSTFINTFVGKKSAKTGNRPGVTKTQQWIRIHKDLALLDTPGVLWPKFDTPERGLHLAFTGAIREEILDRETLALELIKVLKVKAPKLLEERYNINGVENLEALEVMDLIGKKRGAILRGGFIDYERTATLLLDEFRKGMMGPVTLERVEDCHGFKL